jgi:spore germination protein GerM
VFLRKAFHREGRKGREGKKSSSLVIKINNLVIASGFTLPLISLVSFASLPVQMLDLG